jgi:hypothetical protein
MPAESTRCFYCASSQKHWNYCVFPLPTVKKQNRNNTTFIYVFERVNVQFTCTLDCAQRYLFSALFEGRTLQRADSNGRHTDSPRASPNRYCTEVFFNFQHSADPKKVIRIHTYSALHWVMNLSTRTNYLTKKQRRTVHVLYMKYTYTSWGGGGA